MNTERAQAYGEVVRTLADKEATRLLQHEAELLREAADTLVLAPDLDDAAAVAIDHVEAVTKHLVESGRWEAEEAAQLRVALAACGPAPELVNG